MNLNLEKQPVNLFHAGTFETKYVINGKGLWNGVEKNGDAGNE